MMRVAFPACCLCLLLAQLPATGAQFPPVVVDDAGDDDDATQDASALAEQVSNEVLPQLPTVGPKPQGPTMPKQEKPSATIKMTSSLSAFGQKHQQQQLPWVEAAAAAPPAPAQPAAKKEAKAEPEKLVEVKEKNVKDDSKLASKAEPEKLVEVKDKNVKDDSKLASKAAATAMKAAEVANNVAMHSVNVTNSAKTALSRARDALHNARVDSAGLSGGQKKQLKEAEAKLREATKAADFGSLKMAKYVKADVDNKKLQKLEKKMEHIKKSKKAEKNGELEAMRKELAAMRKELKKKEGDKADDDALLQELQDQIAKMEKEDNKDDKNTKQSHDEMKSEIERLRAEIKEMQDAPPPTAKPEAVAPPAPKPEPVVEQKEEQEEEVQEQATPVESKGIDIDTAMPYGDLEPFGREDTAQELTESSISESNAMVDQLERAEVAEEKRSVFRALTRLRGAAITSFDGVARSQTGNIDEYNKIHKWRNTHPLHHLADEESDVSKWAFPENAD